jgi:hypothetical protein
MTPLPKQAATALNSSGMAVIIPTFISAAPRPNVPSSEPFFKEYYEKLDK